MPQMGFAPTTPVFERAKTIHALDRAATVIGMFYLACQLHIEIFVMPSQLQPTLLY
jgi:hypothetical protein